MEPLDSGFQRRARALDALFGLGGKTALVTGSSAGIGRALAEGLAAAGAAVIVNARDADRLAATAAELAARGHVVYPRAFDVTDRAAVDREIDRFEAEIGPIDIVVNNAGIQHRAPLDTFPVEAFERLWRTNVEGVFHVAQAAARHMIPRRAGRIINIASVMSSVARPTIAPYSATKGAVANLTKGMAADWARHGLVCNAIAPGYFQTPLNAPLTADPAFCRWLEERTPVRRWGNVEELVGACVFLASPAASFMNGHVLVVDGGVTATV